MSSIESTQVTLAIIPEDYRFEDPGSGVLLTGKKIFKQMETNRVWRRDPQGKQCVVLMFDGREFTFYPGKTITVAKNIAHALISSSIIVVGDRKDFLVAPAIPFIHAVGEHELGEQNEKPKYSCPECGVDQETPQRLARHLMDSTKHPQKESIVEEPETDEMTVEAEVG